MIYLVSKESRLFDSECYKIISPEEALEILKPLKIVSADTETEGLDPYTKRLLSVQLGNYENQVVIDCLTIDIQLFKDYLESDRLFIFWNAAFDLKFLYHQRILVKNVYDGILAEKLLWLGYPDGYHEFSLKAAGKYYLDIELDKSVRGQIITKGLTERVIVYAADDIKYEEQIYSKQLDLLKEKDLLKAIAFENEFVKCLAYIEYCGVHLNVDKWKAKMKRDQQLLKEREEALNNWVIDYYNNNSSDTSYKVQRWVTYKEIWNVGSQYQEILEVDLPTNGKSLYKTRVVRDPQEPQCPITDRYELLMEFEFPFVYKDLQGDLFSGFNTNYQCNINWNSPKQVIPFFELLGINVKTFDKKTKESKKSTDSKLLESQADKFPILKLYLDYKETQKVVSTYGENFLKAINPKSGRIHTSFHQLGTDTGRLSSGGGVYKINLQNLPHDSETRACFTAIPGYKWISCDYTGQESYLIASIANDPAMIDLFENGCGDIHSLVARMSYPKEIGDTPVEDIKSKFKHLRQDAKGIEFAINYGGNADTIAKNKGIPKEEAQKIYDNYMRGFSGVKKYQDFRRKDVFDKGYILINSITGHKSFISDIESLNKTRKEFNNQDFWQEYRRAKATGCDPELVDEVKHYFSRKSEIEKQSINYVIQGNGALCFKLASIKLFNYLKTNNLLFKVLYVAPVHDEINVEAPQEIANEIGDIVIQCMEKGAAPFCTKLKLSGDKSVGDFWIH